jgi:hypothetical protein
VTAEQKGRGQGRRGQGRAGGGGRARQEGKEGKAEKGRRCRKSCHLSPICPTSVCIPFLQFVRGELGPYDCLGEQNGHGNHWLATSYGVHSCSWGSLAARAAATALHGPHCHSAQFSFNISLFCERSIHSVTYSLLCNCYPGVPASTAAPTLNATLLLSLVM